MVCYDIYIENFLSIIELSDVQIKIRAKGEIITVVGERLQVEYMNKEKMLYVILCALGGGIIGFFANQLTEWYGCVLFGLGVALMVYSIINLNK